MRTLHLVQQQHFRALLLGVSKTFEHCMCVFNFVNDLKIRKIFVIKSIFVMSTKGRPYILEWYCISERGKKLSNNEKER